MSLSESLTRRVTLAITRSPARELGADARRAFVPAHLLQGTSQVLPVQDLGEQRAGRNRLGLEGKTRYFLA
ncbi:MAG: hypothetical protein ACYCY2_15310 [Acidithiobacillus ferriphilus]